MPERYCDLVMKGGVTSGLVFPKAVLKLSNSYGFKQIGGTSAGAIAAVMTAAAEVGRRNGSGEGFEGFAKVTGELTTEGVISGLFQPAPEARGLLDVAKKVIAGGSVPRAIISLLVKTAPGAGLPAALAAAAFAALAAVIAGWFFEVEPGAALWIGVLAAVPGIIVCWAALGLSKLPGKAAGILHGNFFGLCSGRSHEAGQPALLEWMDQWTRRLAGTRGPVVYRDLWTAAPFDGEPGGDSPLDLVVYTSNLSYREPCKLPFDVRRFYFNEAEFRRLLPKSLLDWMVEHSPQELSFDGIVYRRLPQPEHFPIVVAARMSLSFPILLSAIPLYVPDYPKAAKPPKPAPQAEADADPQALQSAGDPPEKGRKPTGMKACWFSDGGLTLNFPIHLFDAPLPRWPTFAINLVYPKLRDGEKAPPPSMPQNNREGWRAIHHPFLDPAPMAQLGSLVGAMLSTIREWRDNVQVRAPGYRDRIVHVPLESKEGGLNLDMPKEVLDCVAAKGEAAGEVILERFKFPNHYWVRYRNSMAALETHTAKLVKVVWGPPLPGYEDAWMAMRGGAKPPSYPFSSASQIKLSKDSLDVLQALAELTGPADLQEGAPRPVGELRVLPKL